MNTFALPLRIYYEDTDFGGVVYHSKYLNFMERARSELVIQRGLDFHQLAAENIIFVVAHIDIDFLKPATLNEQVEATADVVNLGNTSITFLQTVRQQSNKDWIFAKAKVKVVCVNHQGRPIRIPNVIKEALQDGH